MSLILKQDSQAAATSQITIDKLDNALGEKLQPKQNTLLLGPPLSGKSTLAIQFLASGLNAHEGAVLVTTTNSPNSITKKARALGWNLEGYEKHGDLRYVHYNHNGVLTHGTAVEPESLGSALMMLSATISRFRKQGRKVRFVFDNLTTLLDTNGLYKVALFLHELMGRLKAADATSIFILEDGDHDGEIIRVLRSMCDGVLKLDGSVNVMARGVPTSQLVPLS